MGLVYSLFNLFHVACFFFARDVAFDRACEKKHPIQSAGELGLRRADGLAHAQAGS